jgi:hypothetical protein
MPKDRVRKPGPRRRGRSSISGPGERTVLGDEREQAPSTTRPREVAQFVLQQEKENEDLKSEVKRLKVRIFLADEEFSSCSSIFLYIQKSDSIYIQISQLENQQKQDSIDVLASTLKNVRRRSRWKDIVVDKATKAVADTIERKLFSSPVPFSIDISELHWRRHVKRSKVI